jgi:Ca2+-binding EF-hand superfamily protein
MYDDDEGGTIDFNNLRKVATELEEDIYIDDEEIELMIKMADTKGVGSVDLEDFMAIMQRGKLFD